MVRADRQSSIGFENLSLAGNEAKPLKFGVDGKHPGSGQIGHDADVAEQLSRQPCQFRVFADNPAIRGTGVISIRERFESQQRQETNSPRERFVAGRENLIE